MTRTEIERKCFLDKFEGNLNRWQWLITKLADPLAKAFGKDISVRDAYVIAQKMADIAIDEVINVVTDKE